MGGACEFEPLESEPRRFLGVFRDWDYCIPPQLPEVDCHCDISCLYNDDCCVDFQYYCPKEYKKALAKTDVVSQAYHVYGAQTIFEPGQSKPGNVGPWAARPVHSPYTVWGGGRNTA